MITVLIWAWQFVLTELEESNENDNRPEMHIEEVFGTTQVARNQLGDGSR